MLPKGSSTHEPEYLVSSVADAVAYIAQYYLLDTVRSMNRAAISKDMCIHTFELEPS